jgi:hypothetical protein
VKMGRGPCTVRCFGPAGRATSRGSAVEQIHHVSAQLGVDDGARASAQAAFHHALVAHLALNNMLTMAGDHRLVTRLLAMPADEFDKWLDATDAEGSVTG